MIVLIVGIVLACIVHTHGSKLAVSHAIDMKSSLALLAAQLGSRLDRAIKLYLIHRTTLDNTTLVKKAPARVSGHVRVCLPKGLFQQQKVAKALTKTPPVVVAPGALAACSGRAQALTEVLSGLRAIVVNTAIKPFQLKRAVAVSAGVQGVMSDQRDEKEMKDATAFYHLSSVFASVRKFGSFSIETFDASPIFKAYIAYCEDWVDTHARDAGHWANVTQRRRLIMTHWDTFYGRKRFLKWWERQDSNESAELLFQCRQLCAEIDANSVLAKGLDHFCVMGLAGDEKDHASADARETLQHALTYVRETFNFTDVDALDEGNKLSRYDVRPQTQNIDNWHADEAMRSDEAKAIRKRARRNGSEKVAEETIWAVFESMKWFAMNVVLPIAATTDDNYDAKRLVNQSRRKLSFCYWLYEARKEFQTPDFQSDLAEALRSSGTSVAGRSVSRDAVDGHPFSFAWGNGDCALAQLLKRRPRLAAFLALEHALHIVRLISLASSSPVGLARSQNTHIQVGFNRDWMTDFFNCEVVCLDRRGGSCRLRSSKSKLTAQYFFLAQRVVFLTADELLGIIGAKLANTTCRTLDARSGTEDKCDTGSPREHRFEGVNLPAWKHESWSYGSRGLCEVFRFQALCDKNLAEKGGFIFVTLVGAAGNAARRSVDSDAGHKRDRLQGELYCHLVSKEFFSSPSALFTPVSAFSRHSQEMEMMISPGTIYDILSVFIFPNFTRNFKGTGKDDNRVQQEERGVRKTRKRYLENAFSIIDARLTELFIGSEGARDIKWTEKLLETLHTQRTHLPRLNGVVIVKLRDPSQSSSGDTLRENMKSTHVAS